MTVAIDGAEAETEGRAANPQFTYKSWENGQSAAALKSEPFWKVIGGLEEVSQAINKSSIELKR